jgi:hypothetical protein
MLRAEPINDVTLAAELRFRLERFVERARQWVAEDSPWWLSSLTFHFVLLCLLLLVGTQVAVTTTDDDTVQLMAAELDPAPPPVTQVFEVQPLVPPKPQAVRDDLPVGKMTIDPEPGLIIGSKIDMPDRGSGEIGLIPSSGGGVPGGATGTPPDYYTGATYDGPGFGPRSRDPGVGGYLDGLGKFSGSGGTGHGFKHRIGIRAFGSHTPGEEFAIYNALKWLARHQMPDGRWSLAAYTSRCQDKGCTWPGNVESDTAATSMGLLPFLAAGQTHLTGEYQKTVLAGLRWLVKEQRPDGDLRGGSTMYAHGLATIALCEAYGMTGDRVFGDAAQRAIHFIERAQNPKTGGWRYAPGEEGDTSVVRWAGMAVQSAQRAYLRVRPLVLGLR